MKPISCALAAQRAGEDLIGTAGHYQTYVLIETPMPWAAKAFNSKCMPSALRQYVQAAKAQRSVQFLCINRGVAGRQWHHLSYSASPITLLIYERANLAMAAASKVLANPLTNGYRGYEFKVETLEQVRACLEAHWQGDSTLGNHQQQLAQTTNQRGIQDILICTHGMRDQCCARLGQPFFRDAKRMVSQHGLANSDQLAHSALTHIRIWKVSHIGGHRFAPTAISLPDGRYYGRLTLSALKALLTRSGSISQLRSVYRGWGILPQPLQVLERQLMLSDGWSWLNNSITYQFLRSDKKVSDKNTLQVSFSIQTADNTITTYRARIVQDIDKTCCVSASCGESLPSTFIKYRVAECSVAECSVMEHPDQAHSNKTHSAAMPAMITS